MYQVVTQVETLMLLCALGAVVLRCFAKVSPTLCWHPSLPKKPYSVILRSSRNQGTKQESYPTIE